MTVQQQGFLAFTKRFAGVKPTDMELEGPIPHHLIINGPFAHELKRSLKARFGVEHHLYPVQDA